MPRTEEQIIAQQGAKVKLGDKEYELKPLTMRKAQAWREKLSPMLQKIVTRDAAPSSTTSLNEAITQSPEEMGEIVFSYLGLSKPERNEVMDSATEQEMHLAFQIVMELAFRPFLSQRSIVKATLDPTYLDRLMKLAESAKPSMLQ